MTRRTGFRVAAITFGLVAGWQAAGLIAFGQRASEPLVGAWTLQAHAEDDPSRQLAGKLTFTPTDVTFESEAMPGYQKAAYEEDRRRFGPSQWKATMTNPAGDALSWSGMADGQNISGTVEHQPKSGEPRKYLFKGTPG